jgi:Fe-S-cluster containining protein
MNVPAIAQKTFELLKNQPEFLSISRFVVEHVQKIKNSLEKARFVHNVIDELNKEVFAHPILQELVPCKSGCTACCHTQVSVTKEEAELLNEHLENGLVIDLDLLSKQAQAGNYSQDFFSLSYNERKCVFLGENGACRVYQNRPSVCRTNAVVGEASQCDTRKNPSGELRLVKTQKADMAIYGFFAISSESGTLPSMLAKILSEKKSQKSILEKDLKSKKSVLSLSKEKQL